VVSSTPRPRFTPEKDPVPILQEAGWAPGPVWTGGKSRPYRDFILYSSAANQISLGHLHMPIVSKSGCLSLFEPSGPLQACSGIALLLPFFFILLLYSCVHSFSPTLCLSSFTSIHPHILADYSHAKSSSSNRMLSGLMSLWTIRLLCR